MKCNDLYDCIGPKFETFGWFYQCNSSLSVLNQSEIIRIE